MKSILNREMEEKGIVLRELSCRTAAELPAPVLPACRRAPPAGPASFGVSSAPGVHPPELPESFGGRSAPGVHCRSCRNAAEASAAVRQLRRGELGGSSAFQLPEYNPFLLHVAVHGLQRVKARVPFPQFFSTMAEISPTTSLYLLWKYQR